MLRYEHIRELNGGHEYKYFPEGNKDAPGVIFVDANRNGRVIEESKDDIGKRYAFHAIHGIDLSKKAGTIAWY